MMRAHVLAFVVYAVVLGAAASMGALIFYYTVRAYVAGLG